MNRIEIPIKDFVARSHTIFDKQWFLLCCGDFKKKKFNCMTISWGGLGTIWNLPLAVVFVRFSRYTFQFMEKYGTFTLNAFPENAHQPLDVLGKSSGREMDKVNQSGYIPMASGLVQAPTFTEAELTLECRKIYWDDLTPAHFLDKRIWSNYENRDFHRIYFGEVLRISGIEKYKD
jgi:flavin reductase (DIM6/NTAB) family NADH-FMN oxidoreductase RutF